MSDIKLSATAISIDPESVKQLVDQAVENSILSAVATLGTDPAWVEKIERMINQAVVQRTLAGLSSIDVSEVIRNQVNENMARLKLELLENFSSTGIDDRATSCQLTIMDDITVVENKLTTHSAEVVEDFTVKNLIVKGGINTDNRSWNELTDKIKNSAVDQIVIELRDQLVEQVKQSIVTDGINISDVKIDDTHLLRDGVLSRRVTDSNLQTLGILKELQVNETLTVVNGRVGVNTQSPDSALNIWDQEVSVGIGKYKNQEAYIGTSRSQALHIGVNKDPHITVDTDGLTAIKKLRVGVHRIGHSIDVPGWSGTRGDIIFNSNPTPGSAFAWVCLGAFKWKALKAVE